jgi:bacitracin transport system ATP-binding protein
MHGAGSTIICTNGLTKVFGRHKAVDGLNLRLRKGEIYGFLGRNGAGKTTTIRMMLGLVRPTEGHVEIIGERVKPGGTRTLRHLGTLVETPGFYPNLSVYDNLEVQRRLMGLKRPAAIDEAIELTGLGRERGRKAGTLSTGTRQRLGLARALLHKPEILVLDEPTNGLDPAGIKEVRLLLRRLVDETGTTIFMSSHILTEVEQLVTRLGIISRGRLLEEIDYEELRARSRAYLELQVSDTGAAVRILGERFRVRDLTVQEDGKIRVFECLDRAGEMNTALVSSEIMVSRLVFNEESLEDHFMKLTQEDYHVQSASRRGP